MGKGLIVLCSNDNCAKLFLKDEREIRRQNKRGKVLFFCSRACSASYGNRGKRKGTTKHLVGYTRRDQHTPFRFYVRVGERRDRNCGRTTNITTEYLLELWNKQNGICPFTGWYLILPKDCEGWNQADPKNASLDRIDNTLGYVIGNVRFISVMANYARNTFTDEQLINFCNDVAKHNKNGGDVAGEGES